MDTQRQYQMSVVEMKNVITPNYQESTENNVKRWKYGWWCLSILSTWLNDLIKDKCV